MFEMQYIVLDKNTSNNLVSFENFSSDLSFEY